MQMQQVSGDTLEWLRDISHDPQPSIAYQSVDDILQEIHPAR